MPAATGDTSGSDTTVGDAAQMISGLFDDDMNVAPDAQTPDPEDNKGEDTDDEDRSPASEEEDPEPKPEETEDDPEPTADDEPPKRKLKVPDVGELDEDEVVKGYLRQSDYTRKTQAVADEKKKLDAEVRPKVVQYASKLKELEDAILTLAGKEPDWDELRKTESPEVVAQKLTDWQIHERRMDKLAEARRQADFEASEVQKAEAEEQGKQSYQRLMELVPEWKDEKVGREERQRILKYVEPLGLTREHLANAAHPELFVILRDAMRYRELKAKASAPAPTKAAADRAVLRPGSANNTRPRAASNVTKAVQRAAKTGSTEDAGAALRAMGIG